jgi:hypothetical protein
MDKHTPEVPSRFEPCPACEKRAVHPTKTDKHGIAYEFQCRVCNFCMIDPEYVHGLLKRIADLEAALDFYATRSHYLSTPNPVGGSMGPSQVQADRGDVARKALGRE